MGYLEALMASLYDEKVLGAKDRIALARKLQEQGDNVAAGQMVSGWYVPNTGAAITGAIKNIIGGYKERQAQEDLDKAEREKTAATMRMFNSAGIRVPEEMALQAGTPEQKPSWWDKTSAFVTGGEQPQTIPAKPLEQNVAQNVTPDQFEQLAPAMALTSPELAPTITSIANNRFTRATQKEIADALRTDKREQFDISEQGRNDRAKEANALRETLSSESNETRKAIAALVAASRQNQGGGDPSFMPYQYPTGETGVFDRRTGKISPMPTLTGLPQPQPTGAPTNVPQPQPTGAPPVGGALGGVSVPPDNAAAFAALHPVLKEYAQNLISGMPITNIPTKGGLRGQAQYAASLIDPEYFKKNIGGQADIASAKNAEKMFTTGQYGQNLTSVRTVGQHIDLYTNLVESLQNGNVQTANAAAQKLAKEFGVSGPQTAESIAHIVGPEVSKAVIGNLSSAGERNEFSNMFSSAKSPEQIAQLKEYTHRLLGGRVQSIAATYNDAMKSTGRKFDYEGKGLGRYKPTEEETPAGTPPPAGQGGFTIRLKGQ
jgi:hypothetical protein